jgi:nucleotide-binding universal stress UspA family protein
MAGIKSILVHVDATPQSLARLEITCQLAARHEARITALFGATPDTEHRSFAYSAAATLGDESEWHAAAHDEARTRLQHCVDGAGPPITWCDVVADSITHGFVAEAAYADLLVVGQQAAVPPAGAAPPGFVESIILDSGRPTLVIPAALRNGSVGQRVLVAWDGSAPAGRVLTSALAFLQRAEQVDVVSWSEHPRSAPFSRVDVGGYLGAHGISARLQQRKATRRIVDELAAMATSLAADLVVMGCYGHNRMSERIFGGTSRTALATLPFPLLVSH